MKQCLICQKPLKWIKFKCLEGHVCKECYEVVSISFSQTITQKTKAELIKIYEQRTTDYFSIEFETTRAIGQLVLFDDNNKKICLPNHTKYTRTPLEPEYYDFSELVEYRVILKQHMKKIDKKEKMVGTIEIQLTFNNNLSRSIWLIPNPIQVDSMPYKTMQSLAKKIIDELDRTKGGSEYVSRT
ncbi:hypothetical protein [Caldibacillus thermoamylovorans]|uniref:hypothetical protein n=1 Tax=Bacillaceae TaxID=186817 RepID=UPI000D55F47E|nr:hypothetical protein [Caldibacillus thermoamylovorans]AWI13778.1 hypothetical protein CQJ30_17430 [Caldibacillus thermoamylovorans]